MMSLAFLSAPVENARAFFRHWCTALCGNRRRRKTRKNVANPKSPCTPAILMRNYSSANKAERNPGQITDRALPPPQEKPR